MTIINFQTIKKIAETIDKDQYMYSYLALRCQPVPEEIGSTMAHRSSQWIDGEEQHEQLDGVSAISLASIKWLDDDKYSGYEGPYLILIGSDNGQYGEDNGEVVLTDPIVLDIWRIESDNG